MSAANSHSPGHITAFFCIYKNGSTGAGVNIADGVHTSVSVKEAKKQKIRVLINGELSSAPVTRNVVLKFVRKEKLEVLVKHGIKLPVGYGLGLSGAGALSTAFALNNALKRNFSKENIRQVALQAEIECGTGLGDVTAELYKGFLLGKKPFPSKKAMERNFKKKYVVLAFFAPINTGKIIHSPAWKKKVNKLGAECMRQFYKKKDFNSFMHWARYFTVGLGLANKKILKIMDELPYASQAMLGQTVFVPTNRPGSVKKVLRRYTKRVAVAEVADKGAY